jgi:hypothetical protein
MIRGGGVWLSLVCAGLSGCAAIAPNERPAPVVVADSSDSQAVLDLLLQAEQLAGLAGEAQHLELLAAQAEYERNPGDGLNRLRLALALSMPKVSWRDDARVIALLGDWPPGAEPSLRRQVAQLVYRLATERLRLLKEESRRYETLRDEHRRTDAALRESQRKLEELQQKLDALRAIDRDTRRQPRR